MPGTPTEPPVTEPGSEGQDEGYQGPATLLAADGELAVTVRLRGHFQPIDGHYRWYGRITADPEVTELLGGRKAAVTLSTPQGRAAGEAADPDLWGRYRVTGTGMPPFRTDSTRPAAG
ncbi:DUF4873 domain-containing protein [Streptomyces sp. WMMC897]|uniref:DUF4873 domain-containing protein n=1 Tax=Streptomyces sp. WMMC897 TaxID=3014782 RepID=UPI0022B6C611|nr:DUF4873 domain-containing protein [Streptomyces sp. WMMC897]MCZ7417712.1 DUF4873 domain-containing protein [Streptomyces sp. WMMC897]